MIKESDIVKVRITDEMRKEAERRAGTLRQSKEFLKGMVERMGLENDTIERLVWSYTWYSHSANEFAAIEYELQKRIKRGEIMAEDVNKMIEVEQKAFDEYEEREVEVYERKREEYMQELRQMSNDTLREFIESEKRKREKEERQMEEYWERSAPQYRRGR